MPDAQDARSIMGATAYGSDGDNIGQVAQVFVDDPTGRPGFVTVSTGLLGPSETFIPVSGASFSEREPITDANVGSVTSGPGLSEEEHEVVLTEETPVVEKDVTPVERVRLGTQAVTDEETVTTDVAKERIEVDDDTARTGTSGTRSADDRS